MFYNQNPCGNLHLEQKRVENELLPSTCACNVGRAKSFVVIRKGNCLNLKAQVKSNISKCPHTLGTAVCLAAAQ